MKDSIADRYLSNAVFMDTWTDVARKFLRNLEADNIDTSILDKICGCLVRNSPQSPWSFVSETEWQEFLEAFNVKTSESVFNRYFVANRIFDKHRDDFIEACLPKLMRRWKKHLKSMKEECCSSPAKFVEELINCLSRDKHYCHFYMFIGFIDKRRLLAAAEEVDEMRSIEGIMEQ